MGTRDMIQRCGCPMYLLGLGTSLVNVWAVTDIFIVAYPAVVRLGD